LDFLKKFKKTKVFAIAFVSHGSWQASKAFPCHHPQASGKTLPRLVYAVQKPFAGALLGQWLVDPLGSLGQYSSRHDSYIFRWAALWLGMGCLCFWRTRHKCFYISQNHLTLRQSSCLLEWGLAQPCNQGISP